MKSLTPLHQAPLIPRRGKSTREKGAMSSVDEKIREFVANLSLLVIRPTMAKHNQSPPWGI